MRVDTYGARRVRTAALPGARRTAATTALAEGATIATAEAEAQERRLEGIAGVSGSLARLGLQEFAAEAAAERREADETALLKASNQLSEWTNRALYDPQTGALAKKGEASFPVPEEVRTDFETASGAIAATMKTPAQQRAYAKMA